MHSYFVHVPLHSLHCPLFQEEQGTCSYCHWHRRRHQSCHYGAVANTSPPPVALPRCRSPPTGSLAECPLGVAAKLDWLLDSTSPPNTTLNPHTHTHTHTHTHSLLSRGQAMLGHGHCLPSKTLGQTFPPPRWMGRACVLCCVSRTCLVPSRGLGE